MYRKLALLFIFLTTINPSFSQGIKGEEPVDKLSFSELIEQMLNKNDSVYVLKNTQVYFSKEANKRYSIFDYRFNGKKYPNDTLHIYKTIYFENVHFEEIKDVYNYGFVNFKFHKPVSLKNSNNLTFYNCQFEEPLVYNSLKSMAPDSFQITDCTFNSKVKIDYFNSDNHILISVTDNTFTYSGNKDYSLFTKENLLQINVSKAEALLFKNNDVRYKNETFLFQTFDIDEILFENNSIQSSVWNWMMIENVNNLSFINNKIEADMLFGIDKLNPQYTIQWPITTNKIIPLDYIFNTNKTLNEVTNKNLNESFINKKATEVSYYKSELTHLSKFHSYFKEFHDRQSANDVYIKIKDLETERLAYLYEGDKSFENFFELNVNRFLKRFSAYGTSPSKIVISSLNVILFFAFLFLFSNNSWNKVSLSSINKKIKQSVHYFTTDNNLTTSFEIKKNKLDENHSLKSNLLKNNQGIPKVFYFFSLTIVKAQTKLTDTLDSFWNYFDIIKGNWNDLSIFKKGIYSFLITTIILLYLASKLVSILLNSLTLSVNSFTTLGFGEIPIKGIGRYLAILEGFIGWIFLTLFSVTLISQILS